MYRVAAIALLFSLFVAASGCEVQYTAIDVPGSISTTVLGIKRRPSDCGGPTPTNKASTTASRRCRMTNSEEGSRSATCSSSATATVIPQRAVLEIGRT
jgi:hypothetical protein